METDKICKDLVDALKANLDVTEKKNAFAVSFLRRLEQLSTTEASFCSPPWVEWRLLWPTAESQTSRKSQSVYTQHGPHLHHQSDFLRCYPRPPLLPALWKNPASFQSRCWSGAVVTFDYLDPNFRFVFKIWLKSFSFNSRDLTKMA